MSDFIATTASNNPKINDHEAVDQIIARYFVDPELHVGVSFDHNTGEPYLYVFGYSWPEAWPVPSGTEASDFDPYTQELYEDGADGFIDLLNEIAPHLSEPLTVQAIGSTKCLFPLAGCEWHIERGGTEVEVNEFQHGHLSNAVATCKE